MLDKVKHRIISAYGQAVILTAKTVDQVKESLGIKVRHFQLVEVVQE